MADKATRMSAQIESKTEAHVLQLAQRVNAAAQRDATAPMAEVLTEVYDTPDEVWPTAKVRNVTLSLLRDYETLLAPYVVGRTPSGLMQLRADAPSDEDLRERLKRGSRAYATLARPTQHKHWFDFYTDRTRTTTERNDVEEILELRVAVELGKLTDEEAKARLSRSRAGVMAKARALEKAGGGAGAGGGGGGAGGAAGAGAGGAGPRVTKQQRRDTLAAVKTTDALAAAEARRRYGPHSGGGSGPGPRRGAAMTPDVRALLQARAAAKTAAPAPTALAPTTPAPTTPLPTARP